jgi:hypothetical protein
MIFFFSNGVINKIGMANETSTPPPLSTLLSYDKWTHRSWECMMTYAFTYPYKPTDTDKALALLFYTKIVFKLLLCPVCPPHYQAMLEKHPPDVSNRLALIKWNILVHNIVNKRLEKPEMTYEQVMPLWLGPDWQQRILVEEGQNAFNPLTSNLPSVPRMSLKSILFVIAVLVFLLAIGVVVVTLHWRQGPPSLVKAVNSWS